MKNFTPQPASPLCLHFGTCGGCQYQDITQASQLELKRAQLVELLATNTGAPFTSSALAHEWKGNIATHAAEPYGYRNRIRLRIEIVDGRLRFGYNIRATTEFLPITTCPIAAPILWSIAETILATAAHDINTHQWLSAATELELFTNHTLDKLQLTFSCPPRTRLPQGSFARMMAAITAAAPQVVGASAIAVDPRTGPTGRTLETHGAAGLTYQVSGEKYWISRGGFFQVNRFLLPTLVDLVTANRTGKLAWDLYAGVGLFSRVLARSFSIITAVEANPAAATDLSNALRRLGPQHRAVHATTLDFLRTAIHDRERPGLVVLDPPRAGAGEEACTLLARIAPKEIVYVSCDPTTLARDARILQQSGYTLTTVHLVDLFPQTSHLETIANFTKNS